MPHFSIQQTRILSHPVLLYALSTASVLFQASRKRKKNKPQTHPTPSKQITEHSQTNLLAAFHSRGRLSPKYERGGLIEFEGGKKGSIVMKDENIKHIH